MLQLDWRIPCSTRVLQAVVADQNLEVDRRARVAEQELRELDLAAEVGAVALLEQEIQADLADDQPHKRMVQRLQSLTFRIKRMTADNSWYRAPSRYLHYTIIYMHVCYQTLSTRHFLD